MAAALVVLVAVDTALTGWLLARLDSVRKVVASLGEVVATLDHDVDVLRENMPDPWDGARG